MKTALRIALVLVAAAVGRAHAQAPPDSAARLVVHVASEPFYAIVDEDYDHARRLASGDTLALAPGRRAVRLALPHAADHVFAVRAAPDTLIDYHVRLRPSAGEQMPASYLASSSYPVLRLGANIVLRATPDVDLFVDGEHVGRGTAAVRRVPGRYTVEAVHAEAGTARRYLYVTGGPPRLEVVDLYPRPRRVAMRALSLVPGGAQLARRDRLRGALLIGGTALFTAAAMQRHQAAVDARSAFEATRLDLRLAYARAETQGEALRLGDELEALEVPGEDALRQRDVLVGAALLLYAFNVYDGLRTPPGGFRRALPRVRPALWQGDPSLSLSLRW